MIVRYYKKASGKMPVKDDIDKLTVKEQADIEYSHAS